MYAAVLKRLDLCATENRKVLPLRYFIQACPAPTMQLPVVMLQVKNIGLGRDVILADLTSMTVSLLEHGPNKISDFQRLAFTRAGIHCVDQHSTS